MAVFGTAWHLGGDEVIWRDGALTKKCEYALPVILFFRAVEYKYKNKR